MRDGQKRTEQARLDDLEAISAKLLTAQTATQIRDARKYLAVAYEAVGAARRAIYVAIHGPAQPDDGEGDDDQS